MRDYEGEWAHSDNRERFPLLVRFFTQTVVDPVATRQARENDPDAFPVYVDRPYVRMQSPGDAKTVWEKDWEKDVIPEMKQAYGGAWRAFKEGAIDQIQGTPLSEWPRIPRSLVMGLSHHGIRSVEDVASVTDENLHVLGDEGGHLRDLARKFLTPADQATQQLKAENQELRSEIEMLKAQVETMLKMPAVEDDGQSKRGPGRPRKAS